MKTLFSGDIHNKSDIITPLIDMYIQQEGIQRVVLLGDLLNDYNTSAKAEIEAFGNLEEWVFAKREEGVEVIVLAGNHDLPYMVDYYDKAYNYVRDSVGGNATKSSAVYRLRDRVNALVDGICWKFTQSDGQEVACSHAGFCSSWVRKLWSPSEGLDKLVERTNNMLLKDGNHSMGKLSTAGRERGGFGCPSPCWAGEHELRAEGIKGITQIVGHSAQNTVVKSKTVNNDVLWFCDTHSWLTNTTRGDDSFLMYDDNTNKYTVLKPYK